MPHDLIAMITTSDPAVRNRSLDGFCRTADVAALARRGPRAGCLPPPEREPLRAGAGHVLSGRHLSLPPAGQAAAPASGYPAKALVPFEGYTRLLGRRFEEAIDEFRAVEERLGPSDAIASALAAAYQALGFQTLADQVRRSVRSVRGNQWMFRMGHPADHPLEIRPALKHRAAPEQPFPILVERTAVRMDLSHSGWSDIFFLGMDFPQGARVLNVSVDLGVRGRDAQPQPPIEAWLRVIDQPVLRLTSIDLKCKADVTALADVFDFAKDYLGLLKAAVIAAGIIPSGLEGSGQTLADVLARLVGPGLGLEIVSKVNDIPKGSRLAVSTNLLAAIITVCMRATGQIQSLTGTLSEAERKLVAARAILGEWLGGSGGGWQDSGGIWPGMKMIEGRAAQPGDPEYGISLGRLLPDHHIYTEQEVSPQTRQLICDSFVLVHGGMAQNVGPVLEMVTEKYLLRSEAEWTARQEAIELLARDRKGPGRRRRPRDRPADDAELLRPHPDDHPLGVEPLHGDAHRPGPRQVRRRLLGLPHAGRHFRRRHGVHLRSGAKDRGPGLPAAGDGRHEAAIAKRAALRHGPGGLRLRHQRPRHGWPSCTRAATR